MLKYCPILDIEGIEGARSGTSSVPALDFRLGVLSHFLDRMTIQASRPKIRHEYNCLIEHIGYPCSESNSLVV